MNQSRPINIVIVMDLVRRISAIIASVLAILMFGGCSVGGDPEPPERFYTIVQFSKEEYKQYVLASRYMDDLIVAGGRMDYWHRNPELRVPNYIALEQNYYIADHFYFSLSDVIINLKWEEWNKEDFFFEEQNVLEKHPYSSFFRIGEKNIETIFSLPPSESAIKAINALIDSGDIEQYRVDLGY